MSISNDKQKTAFEYLDKIAEQDHGVLTFGQIVKQPEGEHDFSYFEAKEVFNAWLLRLSVEDMHARLQSVD